MAIGDWATTSYLAFDSPFFTSPPFSVSCWILNTDVTTSQVAITVASDNATFNNFWGLAVGTVSGKAVWRTRGGNVDTNAVSTASMVNGTWHHVGAVEGSATDHNVFLDGAKNSSVTERSPVSLDQSAIGALRGSSVLAPLLGNIAEVAMWDAALTDAEMASLAKGFSPLFIRPANLVSYWPLVRLMSPQPDRVGAKNLTVTGTPTTQVHPRIIMPRSRQIFLPAAVVEPEPEPEPTPAPTPAPDAGGVGRVSGRTYAPTRRRKPERLVFLERELLEERERLEQLRKQRAAQERRAAKDAAEAEDRAIEAAIARTIEQTEQVKVAIASLEAEIDMLRDDEDAINAILRVLH